MSWLRYSSTLLGVVAVGFAAKAWTEQREQRREQQTLAGRITELEGRLYDALNDGSSQPKANTGATKAFASRIEALERQMSLAITFLQGADRNRPPLTPEAARELQDTVDSLRADIDMLLSREWERFDAEALAVAPGAQNDAGAGAKALDSADVEDDSDTAVAAAEPTPDSTEDPAEAPEPVIAALVRESEEAWLHDFAVSSQLTAAQESTLREVVGTLRNTQEQVVEEVMQGQRSASDARDRLRRAHRAAYEKAQGLLRPAQREALRRELQRRNDLYWSVWLSTL
jgi:hypothetical protein